MADVCQVHGRTLGKGMGWTIRAAKDDASLYVISNLRKYQPRTIPDIFKDH